MDDERVQIGSCSPGREEMCAVSGDSLLYGALSVWFEQFDPAVAQTKAASFRGQTPDGVFAGGLGMKQVDPAGGRALYFGHCELDSIDTGQHGIPSVGKRTFGASAGVDGYLQRLE